MKRLMILFAIMCLLLPTSTYAAVSNQPIHWGFKRAQNEIQPEAGAQYDQLLARYGAFTKEIPIQKYYILPLTADMKMATLLKFLRY